MRTQNQLHGAKGRFIPETRANRQDPANSGIVATFLDAYEREMLLLLDSLDEAEKVETADAFFTCAVKLLAEKHADVTRRITEDRDRCSS